MTSHWLGQRFSIPVFAPRSAYFASLSLLTHLIQIISLLEVCSMHELCSNWHAPYTGSIAPYSLSRGNPLKFTLFRNIHSWICAAQRLHARTSVTSYNSVNIYNFNLHLAHLNALWMEYICSLRIGIMAEYPVMSTSKCTCIRIEQTSEGIRVTYEICGGGGGGGLELRTAGLGGYNYTQSWEATHHLTTGFTKTHFRFRKCFNIASSTEHIHFYLNNHSVDYFTMYWYVFGRLLSFKHIKIHTKRGQFRPKWAKIKNVVSFL